jgi:hypothetical protein
MTGDHADLQRALRSAYDFGSDYPHPRLHAAISAEIGTGEARRGAGWLFAGAAAAALGVLLVGVFLLMPRSPQVAQRAIAPSPSFPSPSFPSNLPAGVCAPTVEQLADPNATRIEAKLVTRKTLSTSDPTFHQAWQPAVKYFWVVAKIGYFPMPPDFPRPPKPPVTPTAASVKPTPTPVTSAPVQYMLTYLQANDGYPSDPEWVAHPCRGISLRVDIAPWPTWFDQMNALADVKIK